MRKDNHGFTMIEVLVVIAILVILTTGISLGLNSVVGGNVNKATKTIDAQMKKLRFTTLSREDNYSLFIYKRGGSNYYKIAPTSTEVNKLKDGVKLGKKGMEVQYVAENGITNTVGVDNKYIKITYNRSDGTFNCNYTKIEFVAGAKNKQIILVNATGRHFIR